MYWFIQPFFLLNKKKSLKKWKTISLIKAIWLNNFSIKELEICEKNGIYSWDNLKEFIPNKFSSHYHKLNLNFSNKNTLIDLNTVRNKDRLLLLASKKWIYKWNLINQDYSETSKWQIKALYQDGLILKPQNGSGGANVHHFYINNNTLYQEILFTRLINSYSIKRKITKINDLFQMWRKNSNHNENCLVSPYLKSSFKLPKFYKTPIVRVITNSRDNGKSINFEQAWIEIQIDIKMLIFINTDGIIINPKNKELSAFQSRIILKWKSFIENKRELLFLDSINSSLIMHKEIAMVKSLAWDWIPSLPNPKLLEANAEYSLLLPQLFNFKKNEIMKKNFQLNVL